MTPSRVCALGVAILASATLLPTLIPGMEAPANWGAHGITSGFGRGRPDLQGIVSEGMGGSVDLPAEPAGLVVGLSGDGPIHLRGEGVERTILGSGAPADVHLELPRGGRVFIESANRIRLHDLALERPTRPWIHAGLVALLGIIAVAMATRGPAASGASALFLLTGFFLITRGTLSATFARMALARLTPGLTLLLVFLPLALVLRRARFLRPPRLSEWTTAAFVSSLVLTGIQLAAFEQPLPIGDPAAYFEMGGEFANAFLRLGSPLSLGPILGDLQPYLALPATGVLYGLLRLFGGLGVIYAAQALAMATAAAALVSICETELSPRAAKFALLLTLIHPSFPILPGIVQPEPFILAAWTLGALVALRAFRDDFDARGILGAGVLLGAGLALHPQGLSFLLLALVLCLLPWGLALMHRRRAVLALILGAFSVLLPVAAAERFARPLAHVLDQRYGFFAYTSPHPLGFWLYADSDGWQGPLRIEDTTYQKELIALKGEAGRSSSFADVARFASLHPGLSAKTLLTNLHRLWHQPDNPFTVPFVLPYGLQVPLHRGLVVLFILSLPALLGGRLALLALPFVMLSMTYPAYHVFNKYATPALPFTIIGAALALDRLLEERRTREIVQIAILGAALGALLPAQWFASVGIPGSVFMILVRGLLWTGLSAALVITVRTWGTDVRSKVVAGVIGLTVLLGSSFTAARTDTTRGVWSRSLAQPFEVACRTGAGPAPSSEPAWLLLDAQSTDGRPPRVEVNGKALEPLVPSMPTFGLASIRGRRDPATFRQIWRARVDEDTLSKGELKIRVSGDEGSRIFGDIRAGSDGPRLSLGNWPWLSVYRLMHEGQYRLPTAGAVPPQACVAAELSGRPGVFLARIAPGEEGQQALKSAKPLVWIF